LSIKSGRLQKRLPLQVLKSNNPAEQALFDLQAEALTNVEMEDLKETSLAFRQFASQHPELPPEDEWNAGQLCEYFAMQGHKIVDFNGERVPLVRDPAEWEKAFQWKSAMGVLRLNIPEKVRQENQKLAVQEVMRRQNETDEDAMYAMPLNELAAKARARSWR
jgi:hypothetical protein